MTRQPNRQEPGSTSHTPPKLLNGAVVCRPRPACIRPRVTPQARPRETLKIVGGRHDFSTFRLSLGSILANATSEPEIDEDGLTMWMHEHLRLIAIPVADAERLDGMETAVLAALTPPLNLDKMPRSPIRERLTELRKRYSRRARSH